MPLTEKSKLYVEQRVEARADKRRQELRAMLFEKYGEAILDAELMQLHEQRITSEIERELKKLYNKGILYWRERGDMENSNRSEYAMQYYMNIVRVRRSY